jgi:hypothetical protein
MSLPPIALGACAPDEAQPGIERAAGLARHIRYVDNVPYLFYLQPERGSSAGSDMRRQRSWLKLYRASRLVPARSERPRDLSAAPASFSRAIFRICCFGVLCAASLVLRSEVSRAEETNFSTYTRAAEYCRGDVARPIALSPDKRILCFDGPLLYGQDYTAVSALEDGGFFVVRSRGGYMDPATVLANLARDRHAIVVVYDYCFSACASYLMFASATTFVLKDTLVAWHYTADPSWCASMVWPRDDGPKRMEKAPCRKARFDNEDGDKLRRRLNYKFYEGRVVDRLFDDPPESFTIRRKLQHFLEDTEQYQDVLWTWNPRYYADALIVKIVYEAYPKSQAEVDAMATRFHVGPVLYDP